MDDDGESVKLGFGSSLPTGVTTGSTDETTVSITDDDVPSVTVSFEESSYTVAEGGSETVKVTLSADPERTVTIPITTTNQGGATASDYSVPSSIVFNSGDTEKTLSFSATQDTVNDDGESVKLGFGSSLPAAVTAGLHGRGHRLHHGRRCAVGHGELRAALLHRRRGQHRHGEGDAERRPGAHGDHSHHQDQPGWRFTASDYSVPSSVVFNTGDTEKMLSFSATQDTVDDDGESVKLGFGSSLPTGVTTGSTDETTVSITDDDVPSVTVSFEQPSYTVAEGNTVTVKVTLSADPERHGRFFERLLICSADGINSNRKERYLLCDGPGTDGER